MGILLPMAMGPFLSFVAWARLGIAMPQTGLRRWLAALAGMSPYLFLTLGAWLWIRYLPPGSPEQDPFMAWIGGLMMMMVGLGATFLGTLTVGLTNRSPAR